MFEDFFVTCPLAIALRAAGYDEPCMAAWHSVTHKGIKTDNLFIGYYNYEQPIEIYNENIQHVMKTRPGLLQDKRTNQTMPPWLYAAPLYDQLFLWLFKKGLYLHKFYAPLFDNHERAISPQWGINVFNLDLKLISPAGWFSAMTCSDPDQRIAFENGIKQALKLLKDAPELK